jgi:TP901 family phage tail tape measure protein
MSKIGNLVIGVGLNLKGLSKDLNRASYRLNAQAAKWKSAGRSLSTSFTLPFLAIGGAGVKLAVDLESSFGKIRDLVGVTGSDLDQLKGSVAKISSQTAISQRSLAEGLFAVTSAGIKGKEATELLTQAAKASAIGLGDTRSIALASSAVLNAYGDEAVSASRATDILAATIKYGNLEASSLAPVLGKVIGPAAALGISFEEVGANVATFTKLGGSAENAVTTLGAVMNTFIKPTEQAKKALADVNLTSQDLRDKLKNDGLADTLIFLTETFDGNIEALGQIVPNVRALNNVIGTAATQGTTYKEVLEGTKNELELVDKGFDNVSKTAGFKLKSAMIQLQNASIQLGELLIPVVLKIVKVVTSLVSKFTSMSSAAKETAVKIALVVASIGPAMIAFGAFKGLLGTFASVFGSITKGVIKMWGALTSPLGLVALAFAGLTVLIVKNWDMVNEAIVSVVNYVIGLYNESMIVRGAVNLITLGFKYAVRNVQALFNNLKSVGTLIKKVFTLDFENFGDLLKDLGNEMKDEAISMAEDVAGYAKEAWENTVDPKDMIKPITTDDTNRLLKPLVDGVNNVSNQIKGTLEGVFDFGSGGSGVSGGSSSPTTPTTPATTAPTEDDKAPTEVEGGGFNYYEIIYGAITKNIDALKEYKERLESIKSVLGDFADEAVLGLVSSLGGILENFNGFGDAAKRMGLTILSSVGSTMQKLGKIIIVGSVAMKKLRKYIQSFGAIGAGASIAGGIALLALGKAISNRVSSVAGGSGGGSGKGLPKLAKGGVLTGETMFIGGEYAGAANNPEIVTPQNIMAETFRKVLGQNGTGGSGVGVLHMDTIRFGLERDQLRVT